MSSIEINSYFYEIYEAMPRQGPGDPQSTARALALLPALGPSQRILDIGCGSGAQTIDLVKACPAQIVAVDSHAPFVAQLSARASRLGLGQRLRAQVGDMNDLPFPDGSFDLIWSEGAIFIMGFEQGLASWRRLLAPGGHLVVSEMCWLCDNPTPELQESFVPEAPELAHRKARREAILEAGYRPVGEFVLPECGWWDNYYVPLAEQLDRFRVAHAGEAAALRVADRSQHEIDLYRKYIGDFGYVFFVTSRS
jgi:ubiquinone/menaquinone biosynthesis C-methylase UbiE